MKSRKETRLRFAGVDETDQNDASVSANVLRVLASGGSLKMPVPKKKKQETVQSHIELEPQRVPEPVNSDTSSPSGTSISRPSSAENHRLRHMVRGDAALDLQKLEQKEQEEDGEDSDEREFPGFRSFSRFSSGIHKLEVDSKVQKFSFARADVTIFHCFNCSSCM